MQKKHTPPPLNVHRLTLKGLLDKAAAGLSLPEALSIIGIEEGRLMSWYRNGLVPRELVATPGRGKRHGYDVDAVLLLHLARAFVDAGVPVADAVVLAGRFRIGMLVEFGIDGRRPVFEAAQEIASGPQGHLVAILPRPVGWSPSSRKEFVSEQFLAVSLEGEDTEPVLRAWMREIAIRSMIVVDISAIVVDFLGRIVRALDARPEGGIARFADALEASPRKGRK